MQADLSLSVHSFSIRRTLGMFFGYILFFWLARLLTLSILTYSFLKTTPTTAIGSTLQHIGEIAQANLLVTYGVAALLFVVTLQTLHPLTKTKLKNVFDWREFKQQFPKATILGSLLTLILLLSTTLGGHLSYLGFYVSFDEVISSIASALFFTFLLLCISIVEEYILRSCLEPALETIFSTKSAISITGLCAITIKYIQFENGMTWITALNLFLFNITLSFFSRQKKYFGHKASAILLGTFLVLNHIFFGLPFMGQDMPGIFLLRAASTPQNEELVIWLTGGAYGPEAGIIMSVLLLTYILLPQTRHSLGSSSLNSLK